MSDAHFVYEKPQIGIAKEEFPPLDEKLDKISINPMFSNKEIVK